MSACQRSAFARICATLFMLTVLNPTLAEAQSAHTSVRDANELYEDGDYAGAHEIYQAALREAPDEPIIRFNDGSALYRSERFDAAAKSYAAATIAADPTVASRAWYNLGNALYREENLEAAIDAYKQALRIDPQDQNSKHNLEVAIRAQASQDPEEEDPRMGEQDREQSRGQDRSKDSSDQRMGSGGTEGEMRKDLPRPESPRQLTPAEAQELLEAIEEDPNMIRRQVMAPSGRGPEKDW